MLRVRDTTEAESAISSHERRRERIPSGIVDVLGNGLNLLLNAQVNIVEEPATKISISQERKAIRTREVLEGITLSSLLLASLRDSVGEVNSALTTVSPVSSENGILGT